ncbi:MAG TPA: ATP-dependent DNA helicase [Verrucomicrobiae bacterium]|jgi:ATP-dependent DNA helicase DinG|nr:ATP-dependent DNA helicase [Verrucomicrobiae bacterium]
MSSSQSPAISSARLPSLYQFFGPGGLLARTHPAYEFRRGQLQMAEAVEQALSERRHLIVEAGTGTGKTLAYLLPVIRSGKRVIISTGTKTLQEQLFYKDVPFLKEHLGELRVCYMKGRANYLCRKKLYDLTNQPVLNGLDEINQFRIISEWEQKTETGDRAELAGLPEASHLWPKLDARADRCVGSDCQQFDRCFITEMRRRALESDIIIVNHHLFCADLAIKASMDHSPDAGVLPDAGVVVFDEAHELEDIAADYFGVTVSNLRVDDLLRDVEHTLRSADIPVADVLQASARVREHSQLFFAILPPGEGRFAFENRAEFLEENGDEYLGLQNALNHLYTELQAIPKKPEEVHAMSRRVEELRVQLGFIMEAEQKNTVFWIERRGFGSRTGAAGGSERRAGQQNVFLQATPISVSNILQNVLFEHLESAVLTSATLAVSGGFDYIRGRLGIQHARELVVPSHFDYESQALLYVPPDLPDPRDPRFVDKASQRVRQLLEITRGRAFCLFTSYALMNQLYERLLGELEFPMLLQGSAPKNALLDEFRMTPNAVLFATSSFWQGVDVQGEQLSCVIIDKLPFAVPNDPVVAARIKAIDEDGGNAFFEYQVPSAVISLKQGFGRLIRSLHDRGLLCLLDNRILNKRYGRVFLDSLPNYSRTTDVKKVEEFFGV